MTQNTSNQMVFFSKTPFFLENKTFLITHRWIFVLFLRIEFKCVYAGIFSQSINWYATNIN